MCWGGGGGGYAQKAETRITSPSVKKQWGDLQAVISNKAKTYFSQNYDKKKQFHRSFSVNFISLNASAND